MASEEWVVLYSMEIVEELVVVVWVVVIDLHKVQDSIDKDHRQEIHLEEV